MPTASRTVSDSARVSLRLRDWVYIDCKELRSLSRFGGLLGTRVKYLRILTTASVQGSRGVEPTPGSGVIILTSDRGWGLYLWVLFRTLKPCFFLVTSILRQ